MEQQTVGFFLSWFAHPSATGIALAIVFGIIWLFAYLPPLFKRYVLWLVLVVSAFFTLTAVAFVQIPLQIFVGKILSAFFSNETITHWLLLAAIPQILLSGLVQEGAKLAPVALYWWLKGKEVEPGMGLALGVAAGVGFGVFEAQWVHNTIFASGVLNWVSFAERFFAIAFHIAASALAGYGLARGWGWQFYLLASSLQALFKYGVIMAQAGVPIAAVEAFLAVFAVLVTLGALWLRWKQPEYDIDEADIVITDWQ